jgi:hypothetical protein
LCLSPTGCRVFFRCTGFHLPETGRKERAVELQEYGEAVKKEIKDLRDEKREMKDLRVLA